MTQEDLLDEPTRKHWKRPERCAHGFVVPGPKARPCDFLCQQAGCRASNSSWRARLERASERLSSLETTLRRQRRSATAVPAAAGRVLDWLELIDKTVLTSDELELHEQLCYRAESLEGADTANPTTKESEAR